MLALGGVVLAVTPLPSYFTTYYEKGQLYSISGRTELWAAVLATVKQRPILGNGYVAGRFVSLHVDEAFAEAGNLHNGFLEALYNNGVSGLLPVLAMHLVILKNVAAVLKATWRGQRNLLATGILALYINILINGFSNATFGGRAYAPFMLFMGLVVVSESLRRMTLARRRTPRLTAAGQPTS
jgi:O-antigen ligase